MSLPPSAPPPDETSPFGYADIATAEKAGRVQGIFRSVAGRYDLMNDLMSGGIHRLWKRRLVERLAPRPGWRIADVAGGTGDVAARILAREPAAEVLVIDLTPEMVAQGRERLPQANIRWLAGDAEALPLPDRSVNAYTIAFGLRNVARPARALAEARRVLRPGGRFLCLEFSQVALPFLDRLYDAYSFAVLPRLGQLVAGDAASYRYLAESIRRFPAQPALARMLAEAGLARPRWENLSGGIAAIHSAWRI
jgi:demethylmenaquinone methyltransferase/2-methoxy-6-polyprenyl-1,4-benzoquinol methylase